MILLGVFGVVICTTLLIYTSYLDIKNREITKQAQITAIAVIIIGIVTQILHTIQTGEYIYLVYTAAAVVLSICIYSLNIVLIANNKPRFFGGADTLIYFSICSMCPMCLNTICPTAVFLPAAAFIIALIANLIPPIKKTNKRGIPFIVYMSVVWIGALFIPWLIAPV